MLMLKGCCSLLKVGLTYFHCIAVAACLGSRTSGLSEWLIALLSIRVCVSCLQAMLCAGRVPNCSGCHSRAAAISVLALPCVYSTGTVNHVCRLAQLENMSSMILRSGLSLHIERSAAVLEDCATYIQKAW